MYTMALVVPFIGCSRTTVILPAHGRRHRLNASSIVTVSLVQPSGSEQSVDWREATSSFFDRDTRPIMLFDGVCNLCNGGVKFVRDHDRNRIIRFEALQSDAGKKLLRRSGRASDDISSVVLVEKERSYIKSEAVLKIMEYINIPFPQLAFFLQFVPIFLRDFVYDNVANNRYAFFGRTESCDI
ncbi:DCC family protein At1g52590, chloroplastic isoform X2 [Impatiens glandulifera]|uniref:DCC family protein At1g52590, chloroplastic isoform X2 n=1 Tax=Impatiens glandulifera TaxID=253017 RepID=UPI001FB10322|nr:DCC family protein At1g52590, chloroplastic isoform X2 [Impatiens glandulifera]